MQHPVEGAHGGFQGGPRVGLDHRLDQPVDGRVLQADAVVAAGIGVAGGMPEAVLLVARRIGLGEARNDHVVVPRTYALDVLRSVHLAQAHIDADPRQVALERQQRALQALALEQEVEAQRPSGGVQQAPVDGMPAGLAEQAVGLHQALVDIAAAVVHRRSVGLAEDLLGDLPAQRLQQGQFVGAGQAAGGHLRVVEIAAQALVATAEELSVGPFEVEQQAQRLAYPAVLEQRPAQVEHQALEAGRVRVGKALLAQPAIAQGRRVVAAAPGLDAGLDIDVGLPGLERLQGHAAVAVVVETDPLEVVQATPDRQVASPPVGVAPVAHRTPRLGLLQPVRSAAQRRLHAAAVEVASLPPMPGQHVELGQHQRQFAVAGMTEIEADAQAILHHRLADLLVVGAPERAALLDQAIEGKLHVLGGDRHAVAEARPRIDMETHPAVVRGFLDVARQVAVFGERLVQ